jgi:hypothetical protein
MTVISYEGPREASHGGSGGWPPQEVGHTKECPPLCYVHITPENIYIFELVVVFCPL